MKFSDVRKYVTGLLSASFVNKSILDNLAEDENENLTYKGNKIEGGSGGGLTDLPIATTETLGGVIIGSGLSIDESGILSTNGEGGTTITIDDKLDSSSTNPVQNKVISAKLNEVFQSVSSGKIKVAAAITGKGVDTAADATFDTMAENITKIKGEIPQYLNSAFLINSFESIYGIADYRKTAYLINDEIYGITDYSKEIPYFINDEIYGIATYIEE